MKKAAEVRWNAARRSVCLDLAALYICDKLEQSLTDASKGDWDQIPPRR
jgi:hypothetical protein